MDERKEKFPNGTILPFTESECVWHIGKWFGFYLHWLYSLFFAANSRKVGLDKNIKLRYGESIIKRDVRDPALWSSGNLFARIRCQSRLAKSRTMRLQLIRSNWTCRIPPVKEEQMQEIKKLYQLIPDEIRNRFMERCVWEKAWGTGKRD